MKAEVPQPLGKNMNSEILNDEDEGCKKTIIGYTTGKMLKQMTIIKDKIMIRWVV